MSSLYCHRVKILLEVLQELITVVKQDFFFSFILLKSPLLRIQNRPDLYSSNI